MTVDLKRARWVKMLEDGQYTMEPAAEQRKDNLLCRSCGINGFCPVFKFIHKADKFAKLGVRRCEKYFPVLGFRPPHVGLDERFNTLRVGETWTKRVVPGKTLVALVDTKTDEVLGYARVKRVHSGPYQEMLEKHAQFNHNMKGVQENPIEYIDRILRKAHGHFLNEQSKLTALYLERVPNEQIYREKDETGRASEEEQAALRRNLDIAKRKASIHCLPQKERDIPERP